MLSWQRVVQQDGLGHMQCLKVCGHLLWPDMGDEERGLTVNVDKTKNSPLCLLINAGKLVAIRGLEN